MPSSSVSPAQLEYGEQATFTHSVTASIDRLTFSFWAQTIRTVYKPDSAPTQVTVESHIMTVGSSGTYPAYTDTVNIDTSYPIGTRVCEQLLLSSPNNGGTIGSPNPSSPPEGVCTRVISRPVVHFSGADVATCNSNTGIYAYAKNKGGVYYGSGTQYAAIVQGVIDGAAAHYHGFVCGNWGVNPKILTFANTSGTYGGGFGGSTTCYDYSTEQTPVAATLISSKIINPGQHVADYMTGNVLITGAGVRYNTVGWTSANIPSYRLIVSGNIYIDKSVTWLDGFYFATGKIYTCTNGVSNTFPGYADCANPLTVVGALQANYSNPSNPNDSSIKWWRTTPTMNTNTAAENIIFSPEMYFSQDWSDYPTSTSTSGSYSDMRSLPPVF
jgi:hypothetical protein